MLPIEAGRGWDCVCGPRLFTHLQMTAKDSELRFVNDVPSVGSISSSGRRGQFPIPTMGNGTTS